MRWVYSGPAGVAKIGLIDPPWLYRYGGNGAAKNHYPMLTDAGIAAMPIDHIFAPDAILVVWATWPKVDVAIDVIRAWGFKHKTGFPWIKIQSIGQTLWGDIEFKPEYGTGFWVRGASEPVLIATRGNVSYPDSNFVGLLSPNGVHSRKPEDIYEYARSLDDNGPFLELFARQKRPGWMGWGNEVDSDIDLQFVEDK